MLRSASFLVLLAALPLSAADAFYGTWKMRPSEKPEERMKQVVTIEPVADGVKVVADIEIDDGTKVDLSYTTKLDGEEVPVYASGNEVMKIRVKRTGPNVYEGSTEGPGGTSTFKTTISDDGKVMTTESTSGPKTSQAVFDLVK